MVNKTNPHAKQQQQQQQQQRQTKIMNKVSAQ